MKQIYINNNHMSQYKYDVTLNLTLTVELGGHDDEPKDDDIIDAYLARFMNLMKKGELDNKDFCIEESEQ